MEFANGTDDKELFKLIADSDASAFRQLFNRYSPQLSGFISALTKSESTTDEILQEVFMRVWFNREKLAVIDDPKSYIMRLAAVVCYNALKQMLVDNKITNFVVHESRYVDNQVSEHARLYRLAADIQHALNALPQQQKKVYLMSREKHLKVSEIAEELSLSPNLVRNLLNSSFASVHEQLLNKGHSLM